MSPDNRPSPNVDKEGSEDYYMDPMSGLLVFTAKYHLKRGHCCANNCRHCPYPKGQGTKDLQVKGIG